MGNSCLTLCSDLWGAGDGDDPRMLCHTRSIHPHSPPSPGGSYCRSVIVGGDALGELGREYEVGEELGRGQFGVIRACRHRSSGAHLACKSIAKSKLTTAGDVRDVQREIEILRQLAGHPNIVELKQVVEEEKWVHLVMELCPGGELFDRIVERKMFSEAEAAQACKTVVEVIQFCHANGVIHRDLKPENILLASKSHPSDLKIADFGLAVRIKPGEAHSGMAGSAYYIAPEVLRGEYGQEIDVWSAGVVLYVLLSGVPPFWDETEDGIFDAIRAAHLDLSSDPWPQRSPAVKDLLRGMLCHDVRKRLTPGQILNHEWIVKNTSVVVDKERLPHPPSLRLNPKLGSWKSWQTSVSVSSSSSSGSDTGFLEGLLAADNNDDDDGPECFQGFALDDSDEQQSTCRQLQPSDSLPPELPAARPIKFDKWTSFAQVTEPTFDEFLSAVVSSLDDRDHSGFASPRPNARLELSKAGCTCTVLAASKSRRTLVIDSPKARFLVVHDRVLMRIGWKQLPDSAAAAACSLPDSHTLLWSSFVPHPH